MSSGPKVRPVPLHFDPHIIGCRPKLRVYIITITLSFEHDLFLLTWWDSGLLVLLLDEMLYVTNYFKASVKTYPNGHASLEQKVGMCLIDRTVVSILLPRCNSSRAVMWHGLVSGTLNVNNEYSIITRYFELHSSA